MGRYPFGNGTTGLKKGAWTQEEDEKLVQYIERHTGHGSWSTLPKRAGLNRCGKSCRLRWTNYLRPDIKRGEFTHEEELIIINLHSTLGNKWSRIASQLPGRTDNEIKNYWNTRLRKKLLQRGLDPKLQGQLLDDNLLADLALLVSFSNTINPQDNAFMSQVEFTQPATILIQQNLKAPRNDIQFDGSPYNFGTITQSHHEDPSSMTHYGNGFQVPQVLETTNNFMKCNYNYLQNEIKVSPGLVPDSGETSNVTRIPSCPAYPSSMSANHSIFEALERFLNDEASWEDINTS